VQHGRQRGEFNVGGRGVAALGQERLPRWRAAGLAARARLPVVCGIYPTRRVHFRAQVTRDAVLVSRSIKSTERPSKSLRRAPTVEHGGRQAGNRQIEYPEAMYHLMSAATVANLSFATMRIVAPSPQA